MAISLLRMPSMLSVDRGTRSRPCQKICPATMRPGGMAISFRTESAVTVLPQPELADDADGFAAMDRQVDAVHGLHHAVVGGKVRLEAANFQQRFLHQSTLRGSSASRRPSPMKLMVSTVKKMAAPGNNAQCGAMSR